MAETKLTDLLLRWRGAGFVVPTIKICRNSEAGASSSLADELEDLLVTDEWLASPLLGNFREQTMVFVYRVRTLINKGPCIKRLGRSPAFCYGALKKVPNRGQPVRPN